jgi:hypothetical protein
MVPWAHAGCAVVARLPHRSRRGAKCLTDEGEKCFVVEGLYEKGKGAAFQRSGANRGCFPAGHHDRFVSGATSRTGLDIRGIPLCKATNRPRSR